MKKLLITLLLGMFLFSLTSVSALEFDNRITSPSIEKNAHIMIGDTEIAYRNIWEKYKPINIKNWLGLGKTLFSGAITQHDDVCGTDCSSTIQVYLADDGVLIDDIIFKTLQEDGNWTEQDVRSYHFLANNIPYFIGSEVKAGNYEVKLDAKKKPTRTVDWIIKTNGRWLESWATWGNISEGDEAEVILNSPINNIISQTLNVQFNCSIEIPNDVGIVNVSLWTNKSGWSNEGNIWSNGSVLYDNFNDNSINTTLWTIYENQGTAGTATVLEQNQKIEMTSSGSGDGTYSQAYLDSDTVYSDYLKWDAIKLTGSDIPGDGHANNVSIGGIIIVDETDSNRVPVYGDYATGTWELIKVSDTKHLLYKDSSPVREFNVDLKGTIRFVTNSRGGGSSSEHDIDNVYIQSKDRVINFTVDDTTLWTCSACDTDGDCGFATENRTFTIDKTIPTFESISGNGTQDYGGLLTNHVINFSISDTNINTCWHDYNETNTTFSCSSGVNDFNFTLVDNEYNTTIWANDSAGNENHTLIEWDYLVFENNRTHNTTSYETASETFSIYVTANSSLAAVTLDYNGTDYSATQSGNTWSKTIDVPLGVSNNSIDWKFTHTGNTISSDYTAYQNISEIVFTLCNVTYSDDFLNITFKDESDLSNLNASIPTSTFEYYLGSGDVTKTYNLINNTDNYNYSFCATPDRTLHVDPYVQYKRDSDYPQRTWDAIAQDYTSTVSTQILYLLESADGLYVTIQVVNDVNQLLSGVYITADREVEGTDTTIAFGTTGDAGTVTFWLNPDFSHDFNLSKVGYTDYITSFIPTQSSYTITMGGASAVENNTIQGILYSIIPTNTYLLNDTSYTFGFNLTSSFWDVSDYGFDLRLKNGTIITGDNTGVEGTSLTKAYDVNNQTIVYLDYYWLIEDDYTNATIYWIIQNTANTQWSIAYFFTDLNTYLDSGIYGLDDFGRNLIVFLILFISVGIMSYKFGATSPLAISSLIFGIVFFFDVVVGLIPNIRGIEYLPTFLSALILTLAIFNEVRT